MQRILTSVILHRARMAAALYKSSFPVMSLVKLEVTIITSSAMVDNSLIPRYIIRRRITSWDWKSFVMAKNVSVASVVPSCSPWITYKHFRYIIQSTVHITTHTVQLCLPIGKISVYTMSHEMSPKQLWVIIHWRISSDKFYISKGRKLKDINCSWGKNRSNSTDNSTSRLTM